MTQANAGSALNDAMAACNDGVKICREAARKTESSDLRDLLQKMAEVRQEATRELIPLVIAQGKKPPSTGTIAGATHRLLTSVQMSIAPNGPQSIAGHLKAGDELILDSLDRTLKCPSLPSKAAKQVDRARSVIAASNAQILAQISIIDKRANSPDT